MARVYRTRHAHILLRARVGLVLTLALLTASTGPGAAAAPAKGTEILWDTFGIPHIFARRSPEPVPCVRVRPDGRACRTARAPLRAGARTRGGVLRRLLPGERPLGADDRHPGEGEAVGVAADAGVRRPDSRLRGRTERVGREEPDAAQRRGQGRPAVDSRRRLRARAAHHSLRLADQRTDRLSQGTPTDRSRRMARTAGRSARRRAPPATRC